MRHFDNGSGISFRIVRLYFVITLDNFFFSFREFNWITWLWPPIFIESYEGATEFLQKEMKSSRIHSNLLGQQTDRNSLVEED